MTDNNVIHLNRRDDVLYFDFDAMDADPNHPHWAIFNTCLSGGKWKPSLVQRLKNKFKGKTNDR